MAEYIDRTQIYYDVDCSTCNGHSNPNCDCDKCLQKFVASKNQLDNITPADVVEREKIDKAIEEIQSYKHGNGNMFTCGLNKALEIIKRNIGE